MVASSPLLRAFNRSIKAVEGLDCDLNAAAIETARSIIRQIDPRDPFGETKPQPYLVPFLIQVLKELHLTPEARAALAARAAQARIQVDATPETDEEDELASLRRTRGRGA